MEEAGRMAPTTQHHPARDATPSSIKLMLCRLRMGPGVLRPLCSCCAPTNNTQNASTAGLSSP